MAVTGKTLQSLRFSRLDNGRLALALAISVAIHLTIFGGYELSKQLARIPWMHMLARKLIYTAPAPVVKTTEQPLEFMTVETPSETAPQNAKYFGAYNSKAANPDLTHDSDVPQIDGKQSDYIKTTTANQLSFKEAQPAPASKPAQSQPTTDPGDLTLAKLNELIKQQEQQQQRPRTLAQARQIPGQQMRQEGGVTKQADVPAFDVKLTGDGQYDELFYEAVSQHWWDLLDSGKFALDRSGKVVLQFRLNYDGSITDMKFVQNDVGELLGYVCQEAILDGAPYKPFSSDMRRRIGDYCDAEFTFLYYY